MRQAQYRLAPVEGDTAEGEVNVFYFGPQSGGGVEANLTRWIGQMTLPDGGDPASSAERSTFTADGMPGHVVALDGSYKSGGGRPMGGDGEILEGYRLVGVVVEASGHYAKVLLLIDPNSAVDALVQSTRARGIVKGAGEGVCVFDYVLRKHAVSVGDTVVSSGLDGIFSKGLRVGRVSEIVRQNAGIFQKVSVTPYVDFEILEEVFIISNPDSGNPSGAS